MLHRKRIIDKVLRRTRIVAEAFRPIVCRAPMSSAAGASGQVAVVGGGVSGLYCAQYLVQQGYTVTVFDLGKHCPGGRLTTRRTTWKGLQFDHGCQFVRPARDTFKSICQEWLSAGVVAPWEGKVVRYEAKSGTITDRIDFIRQQQQQEKAGAAVSGNTGFLDVLSPGDLYIGVPSSDAITNYLAGTGATVRNDVKIAKAAFDSSTKKWLLEGVVRSPARTLTELKQLPPITPWNMGMYDGLILADKMTGCPGTPGFVELQGSTAGTKLQSAMAAVGSTPILALLMAYQPLEATMTAAAEKGTLGAAAATQVLHLPFDAAAVVNSEEISWICVDSNKPGRSRADGCQTVVALATPEFSSTLVRRNPDGTLPPQTPELLAQMVPPMFAAVQKVLQPLLRDRQGRLQEPAFVQVGQGWAVMWDYGMFVMPVVERLVENPGSSTPAPNPTQHQTRSALITSLPWSPDKTR
eukprot:GHUV01021655.1.p1 GENE.GHUV01021655.1~~GHUV01021655.1.p1  ORF type:complete len:467 (+),score=105.63 GHUV01021655.1:386-1786(+)